MAAEMGLGSGQGEGWPIRGKEGNPTRKIGRPASRDLRSIVQTRANWHGANFVFLHSDKKSFWHIILYLEQIIWPIVNKIEQHFYGETAVHILLEEDAYSASCMTGSGANHQKMTWKGLTLRFCCWKRTDVRGKNSIPESGAGCQGALNPTPGRSSRGWRPRPPWICPPPQNCTRNFPVLSMDVLPIVRPIHVNLFAITVARGPCLVRVWGALLMLPGIVGRTKNYRGTALILWAKKYAGLNGVCGEETLGYAKQHMTHCVGLVRFQSRCSGSWKMSVCGDKSAEGRWVGSASRHASSADPGGGARPTTAAPNFFFP